VRERIAARLSGRATPEELAAWARGQYLALQQGAPAEEGAREQLETCLQALTLSATGKAKLKDERLVEMMAELER
jgi:3-dehydroquinate dehydratase-2